MWKTLCLSLGGAHRIDGETFLELSNNEVEFPVVLAKVGLRGLFGNVDSIIIEQY
jgi:hypothetical protein